MKCFVYDVYSNSITQIASLPDYSLKQANAVKTGKDTILLFGGAKGIINESVALNTLPRDLGFPNTKLYEYSISQNKFTDVSSQYKYQLEFQGICNNINEFHEVMMAERLPDMEKNKIVFYANAWFSCKSGTAGYIHDAYSPNISGGALFTLDLDTKKFKLMNTYGMVKVSTGISPSAGGATKSGLFADVNGLLTDVGYYYANTAMAGYPSKNGLIRNIS